MPFYKKIIVILLLLIPITNVSVAEGDNSWLVGVWELTGGSKKEFLDFSSEMSVTLISGRGRKISGDYQLADGVVKIVYKFKGKKIPIDLSYTDAKDVLQGSLAKTGKTVAYKKK